MNKRTSPKWHQFEFYFCVTVFFPLLLLLLHYSSILYDFFLLAILYRFDAYVLIKCDSIFKLIYKTLGIIWIFEVSIEYLVGLRSLNFQNKAYIIQFAIRELVIFFFFFFRCLSVSLSTCNYCYQHDYNMQIPTVWCGMVWFSVYNLIQTQVDFFFQRIVVAFAHQFAKDDDITPTMLMTVLSTRAKLLPKKSTQMLVFILKRSLCINK